MRPFATLSRLAVCVAVYHFVSCHVCASEGATEEDFTPHLKTGISLSPIVGYEPTYGTIIGGAYFQENLDPRKEKWYVVGAGTFQKKFGIEAGYKLWTSNHWIYDLEFDGNTFYDAYFGEGNRGRKEDRVGLQNLRLNLYPTVWYRLTHDWSVGALSEIRYRDDWGTDNNSGEHFLPSEVTAVMGLAVENDTRDNVAFPKHGSYHLLIVDAGPPFMSNRSEGSLFGRIRQENRFFWNPVDPLVLALQVALGTSVGEPGYQFRFRLGGNKRLRGFEPNRFRGDHYYMIQPEARLQIQSWLGLVWFAGIGDAAGSRLSEFQTPQFTGGMGLRVGLPPDYVARARIDVGVSRENTAVYLNFQEAF